MDYEKAYKQLVEDFGIILNLNTVKESGVISVEDVRKLIPALAESEDERMRAFLHHTFTAQYLCKDRLGKWHGEPVVNILAWLEKQGQTFTKKDIDDAYLKGVCDAKHELEKQGEPVDINPSEFDLRLNKLLKQFESLPKEELASSLSFYLNVVQNDGSYKEEKQGEQNRNTPVFTFDDVLALQCAMANAKDDSDEELYHALQCLHDRVHDAYSNEKQGEQKPIKVPKFKVGDFIQFNGMGHTRYTIKEVCGLSHYINTLDKRMDMSYTDANFELVEQKPAEWSEEDENWLINAINVCELNDYNETSEWLKNKLKSLRPQSTWKPSDKQMELLDSICASNYLTTTNTRVLQELYDALKKLKG